MNHANAVISCIHTPECPGCPFIGRRYADQLVSKANLVRAATARFVELQTCPVGSTRAADPIVGYRARAKLVVAGDRVGLFARGSHDVVDIPECRVQEEAVARVAEAVRRTLPLEVPLSALDLQSAGAGVFITLVIPGDADTSSLAREAARLMASTAGVVGVAVSLRDGRSHQVLGAHPTVLAGAEDVEARIAPDGPFHFVAPGSFAQAHRAQQRAILESIRGALESRALDRGRVLDLYAGVGILSLALAARGASVVAVEAFGPAAHLARRAAKLQGLDVSVEAADAEDVVRRLVVERQTFDVVVVNPPRRGLSPSVRAAIAHLSAKVLVYVSCEPSTLARDLSDLGRRGLAARALTPFDMMPLTEEVETLAILEPQHAGPPAILHEDEMLIAAVKSPHEPVEPQGGHTGSLLSRVRLLPGAERAVSVRRLDVGVSGVCLFARGPEQVPLVAQAVAKGEEEYVALVRGIARAKGTVRRPLPERGRAQPARSRYVRREVIGGHSLLVVRPEEAHEDQSRRHLASVGHPVVGDERYGDHRTNVHFLTRHFLDRPFLHRRSVRLSLEGLTLSFEATLAPDLALVLTSLRAISPSADGSHGP